MELRHLRYLVAVAEDLNFSKAARRLRIAQPALSAQIRVLEEELGMVLLHRSTRSVRLSAGGEVFLPKAREVLNAAAEAEWTARKFARGEIGRLPVGFITSAGTPVFHRILRRFRAAFPGVEVQLFDLPTGRQVIGLRDGSLEVGLHRPPVDAGLFESMPFATDRMVLALPAGHALAGRRRVPWGLLAGEQLILMPRELNPSFHAAFQGECRRAGLAPGVVQEAHEVTTLLRLVGGGHGIAPVVASVASLGVPQVVFRPFEPRGPRLETLLVWRKRDPSPLAQAFVKVAQEVVKAR